MAWGAHCQVSDNDESSHAGHQGRALSLSSRWFPPQGDLWIKPWKDLYGGNLSTA